MALNQKKMEQECINAIKDNKLIGVDEVISFVPFSRASFYNKGLDKLDSIKKALDDQKITIKSKLRAGWEISKSPVLQIALYKLICSPEEFERLSSQKIDHTSKGESMQPVNIVVDSTETADSLKSLIDAGKTDSSIQEE